MKIKLLDGDILIEYLNQQSSFLLFRISQNMNKITYDSASIKPRKLVFNFATFKPVNYLF